MLNPETSRSHTDAKRAFCTHALFTCIHMGYLSEDESEPPPLQEERNNLHETSTSKLIPPSNDRCIDTDSLERRWKLA
jgi:hypothetical protein